jgi:integrase
MKNINTNQLDNLPSPHAPDATEQIPLNPWASLYSLGFSLIPLAAGGKKPLVKWTEFQTAKPDWAQIEQWQVDYPDAKDARRPEHHPAMRWQDVPEFVQSIVHVNRVGSSRPLLEWIILTSARSGESRNLKWEQIDFQGAIWNIPPDNTKMHRLHNVPLSSRCMEILEEQKAYFKMMFGRDPESTDLVFPSPRGMVYSDMTLSKFMKDHKASSDTDGRYAVPHGFRTSFRGWATINEYPEHLIELCLAQVEGNKSIRAYKREQLIELRRPIMQAYTDFISATMK